MQPLTEKVLHLNPPGGLFDETVIANLFGDRSLAARRVLVHRAVAKGEVLRLKPGLFCLARPWRRSELHPFALAGVLHPPAHISLESALAFHGLIPEAVQQVASVTSQRSRAYDTPLGRFTYQRVPADPPRAGVTAVQLDAISWAAIASPWRAIADLVYLRKALRWSADGLGFLTKSLRLDLEELPPIPPRDFDRLRGSIRNRRVADFLQGLQRELAP